MKTGKNFILTTGIFLLLQFILSLSNAQASDAVTLKVFYDNLSPHGKWLKDPALGYVWVPTVEKGFRPYFTNGSWKMTESGSTWISNYAWGWAAFHYGRWVFDSLYGWVWIPGLDWSPSWVVWRTDGKNYGYVPLVPGFTVSQSLGPDFLVPADWWIWIPSSHLVDPGFQKYAKSNAPYNLTMIKATSVVKNPANSSGFISGPRAENYVKTTDQHVTVYTLSNAAKPGKAIMGDDVISLYKPAIKKSEDGNEPVPEKFTQAVHSIGKLASIGSKIEPSPPAAKAKVKAKAKAKKTKK